MLNPGQLHFIRANLLRLLSVSLVMAITSGRTLAEFSEEVVEQAKASTVLIVTDKGGGSGFVINARGHVVTNYHVVKKGNNLDCVFLLGDMLHVRKAKVVCSKPESDLAIIKVERFPEARPMTIASYKPHSNQEVMALGFPGVLFREIRLVGLDANGNKRVFGADRDEFVPATFNGNIAQLKKLDWFFGGSFDAITHSAKLSGGNSGGPLVDAGGNVVGINVGGTAAPGKIQVDYSYAIRASELVELARDHGIPIKTEAKKPSKAEVKPSAKAEPKPSAKAEVKPSAKAEPKMPPETGIIALTGGPKNHLSKILIVSIALLVLVMFILVLRKPRMVLVGSISRVAGMTRRQAAPHRSPAVAGGARPAPGRPVAGAMRLRGRDRQGQSYDIAFDLSQVRASGGRLVIGRNRDLCQLHVRHNSVSRQHATFTEIDGSIYVEDRNSGNGTFVGGRELSLGKVVRMNSGDHLVLGEVDLVFDGLKG